MSSVTADAEILREGIDVLAKNLGLAKAAKFIAAMQIKRENYADIRDRLIGDATLDELFAELKELERRYVSREWPRP